MINIQLPILLRISPLALLLFASSFAAFPQRNNPYASNPVSGITPQEQPLAQMQPIIVKVGKVGEQQPVVAQKEQPTTISNVAASANLTEIYRIGVGDVLLVNLKNAPQGAGYYTVRDDGTIDFPLVDKNPTILGKTVDEVAAELSGRITLYKNPQLEVKVREYVSHRINVFGLAERVGEKSLQREAMPLYVIRAEALVSSTATKVHIRRSGSSKTETYSLRDEKTDDVLIYPGDSVEFTADGQWPIFSSNQFFYISGEVNSAGQKPYSDGMTLFQAVLAAGGAKGNPKKATLRRRNDKGTLVVTEYNLRAIRDGKATDPLLAAGDMIEIGN